MGLLPVEDTLTLDLLTRRPRKTVVEAGEEQEARAMVNVELTVNVYKAGICVDLERVGREEEPVTLVEASKAGRAFPIQSIRLRDHVKPEERDRRIRLLLDALLDFSDYSKQARLLTDFTPDLILVALQSNYSHRLQKALELRWDGTAALDTARLDQVLRELPPDLATFDGRPALAAGMLDGIIANAGEVREVLAHHGIEVTTPREAIERVKVLLGV